METKAKINFIEGIIELEGSEEFVSKYLDEFKENLSKKPYQDVKKQPIVPEEIKHEKTGEQKTKKKIGAKKIDVKEFYIDGDKSNGVPSLKEFFEQKKPGKSASKRILAVGYYVTHYANQEEFSEGNIEYAYKALNLTGRPAHLHQIIINQKNEKGWFDEGSITDNWKISRIGEIFVDEHLPEKSKEVE